MQDVIISHYNFTGKPYTSVDNAGIRFTYVIFSVFCCFIILENALVILIIWKTKDFHKPMYYFIANLALSDLIAGVAYMTNILLTEVHACRVTTKQWLLREGTLFIALSASVCSLLAIAAERYMTMRKMSLHNNKNTCRVFLFIGACWLVSVLMGILPTMGWNCIGKMASCSTVLPLYSKSYILFCITTFSIILVAIIALYVRIYVLVRRRCHQLVFSTESSGSRSGTSDKSLALLKVVVIVLSVFIACWTPLFVLLLLDVACEVRMCPVLYKDDWFVILAVLNSAMNPIIYALTSKEMRFAFLTMLSLNTWREKPERDQTQQTTQIQ